MTVEESTGPDRDRTRRVDVTVQVLIAVAAVIAAAIGVAIVYALLVWVLPTEAVRDHSGLALRNLVVVAIYVGLVVPPLVWWVVRRQHTSRAWVREERAPDAQELRTLLRAPLHVSTAMLVGWLGGAVVFGAMNTFADLQLGLRVALTVVLAGLTTAACSYLLSERLLRPMAVRALRLTPLERPALPGVTARILLSWLLACGIPLAGLLFVGLLALVEPTYDVATLAVVILTLGSTALLVGSLALVLVARSTSGPVVAVRRAMASVGAGDLDVQVAVSDASELGLLQSGFNEMAAGLRERERMRDVFGRHVGEDVARRALEGEIVLGGEVREAAVLFVDLVGSTRLAAERPPQEVVDFLNAFFGIVVAVVDEHGGWVNKFEGDAALAIFGAPEELEDAAGRALAAARALQARLATELPDARAGIGVAHGAVVAGNLGSPRRLEYTVIGDAVNVAARLTERAKDHDPMVLASGEAIAAAGADEADQWCLRDEVQLRGRDAPTRLAAPA